MINVVDDRPNTTDRYPHQVLKFPDVYTWLAL
jgi:hypothetical protein